MDLTKPILMICGPTASGKTNFAIKLAQETGGEIISADSGQVYRGMDIGTAKPTPEERGLVPFHLIDILTPNQQFTAADFRRQALAAIADIQSRGKRPIIVGGTGLYLKVLEDGIFEGPPAQPKIRERLEKRVQEEGIEALYQELEKVDPLAAAGVQKRNRQRIIRALEVYEATGRRISEYWAFPPLKVRGGLGGRYEFEKIGITFSKDELYRRINERVDRMMERGLVNEVKALVQAWGKVAVGLKIIGYKEIVRVLEGEISLSEAVLQIKQNTRQYAKRQRTWFQKDTRLQWRDIPLTK